MALDVLDDRCEVLVLGIGNILWADEGFGPRCVEHFHRLYEDRPEVRVEDGGTLGFYLMNLITSARRILVFDCCDFHEEPGTMMVLRDDDVEPWLTTILLTARHCGPVGPRPREPGRRGCSARKARRLRRKPFRHAQEPA